jgi:Tol biopolymer transport system component
MKRTVMSVLALSLTLGTAWISIAAEDRKANELLEAALTKETIEGDLKGAIALYERAAKEAGSNRALAAKAQLRLAAAHQKQGDEAARTIYERVAREYGDLPDVAAEAQTRLTALRPGVFIKPTIETAGKIIRIQPITFPVDGPAPNPNILFPGDGPTQRQITLFDRQGKFITTVGDPGPPGTMALSPDGKRVALVRNGKVLLFDVKTQASVVLTNGPTDAQPTWSSDGKRIVFEVRAGSAERRPGLYGIPVDGNRKEEFLAPSPGSMTLVSISHDDRYLTYQQSGSVTGTDVFVLPLFGDKKPIPILATPANEMGLRISPDGRFVSYRLSENGRSDAYVSPFDLSAADPTRPIERWKISGDVGVANAGVRWRADGKEIYFIDVNGGVNAASVTTTPTFKASPPKVLFNVPEPYQLAPNATAGFSDVSGDGQVFALMVPR